MEMLHTVTWTSVRSFMTFFALEQMRNIRHNEPIVAYHPLKMLPWFSVGSLLMIQDARWHISCESVFRMRSAPSGYERAVIAKRPH